MAKVPMSAALLTGGRKFSDPQISPDGERLTVVSRAGGGRNELSLFDLNTGLETQLPLEPSIASSRGGAHCWLPDGNGVAYISSDSRVCVFDLESLRTRVIVDHEADRAAIAVSPLGTYVAYVVDLQHVEVASLDGDLQPVRVSDGADFAMDPQFSVDGQWVAWHEWDVPNMAWDGSRIAVRDIEATQPKRVVAGGSDTAVQQPRFSPDGKMLSFLSDEGGFTNLWSVDFPSFGNRNVVFEEKFDHADLTWGPGQSTYAWVDERTVAISRNEGGFGTFVWRDVVSGQIAREERGFFDNVHSGDDVLCALVTDVTRAQELVIARAGMIVTIARGAYVGVDDECVIPESVSWQSRDGVEIPARLYRAGENAPMLVWIHGGPHGQSPATFFPRWKYYLDRGWSILVPDYRGTNGWGREYLQALRGKWGEVDVDDVADGIEAAISNGWVDAGRVVAVGGSAGGTTALSLLARYPNLCAAGVALYPVTDMEAAARETWRFEAHYFDSLVGLLPGASDVYRRRSPLHLASQIAVPVLLLHGDADVSVPCAQSTELAKAIEAAGGTVEMHIYEGEGHGWRKPETTTDEIERVERFLQRYVMHKSTEDEGA